MGPKFLFTAIMFVPLLAGGFNPGWQKDGPGPAARALSHVSVWEISVWTALNAHQPQVREIDLVVDHTGHSDVTFLLSSP
jgi:hypothetical protein